MFKEFGVLFLILILTVAALRFCYQRRWFFFCRITTGLLCAAIMANVGYNLVFIFPDFVYEGVPIGDSEENLFVYKKDSQFRWQILNTISHNRDVLLDEEGELFAHYFELYAESTERIEVTNTVRNMLKDREDFEWYGELDMVELLDYAFPDWQGGRKPHLYLQKESLRGEKEMVGVMVDAGEHMDLYVMSEAYYESLSKQEEDT